MSEMDPKALTHAIFMSGISGSKANMAAGKEATEIVHAAMSEMEQLKAENARLRLLLERLLEWDHFDGAGDGPYWRREIREHLAQPAAPASQEVAAPCVFCGKRDEHDWAYPHPPERFPENPRHPVSPAGDRQ